MFTVFSDEYFMNQALQEAQKAYELGEVPVGAIIVCNKTIIAKAYNQVETLQDITAHAEILALTSASAYLGSKYLNDCTLYVTLEPCNMCAGAIYWSKISKVIYGAADDKNGFMQYGKQMIHPQTKLEYGILENDCSTLLKDFFQSKRALQ